jgi:hypothetical protein
LILGGSLYLYTTAAKMTEAMSNNRQTQQSSNFNCHYYRSAAVHSCGVN